MTNDELKKKICEIIDSSCSFYCGSNVHMDDEQENAIADALIAAGIGDVKTVREIGASAAAMAVFEAAKAEHRAELEERALKTLIKNRYTRCEVPTNLCNGIGCRSNECQKIILEYYLQQAEKELAEENSGKKEV